MPRCSPPPDGRYVVTTDTMVHGPDFRLAWSTPHDLGWKAAATNLSDIAAMGARATALVVAVAAPPDTHVSLLEGLADGLRDACAALAPGCGVVGGDLSVSPALVIAVTAFGDLDEALLLLGVWVPLASLVLAPIAVNILLYHVFLNTAGLPIAILITVLHVMVVWSQRSVFAPLLRPKVSAAAS